MPQIPSLPSYRLHKSSGQAVVTVRLPGGDRRDVYLGVYNTPESRREYARIIAELATAAVPNQVVGSARPIDVTVDEVLLAFWKHAETHYRRADGSATNELMEYRQTFKPVRSLYGATLAMEFGPLALKTVRGQMVAKGLCRKLVNQRIGRVRRVFKWAAGEQLIPVVVFQALGTVQGLQRGRTEARETEPITPVAPEHIRATLPFLRPEVRGVVEFQRLTGCRPSEACAVRRCDIDTSGPVWRYSPQQHKSAWRGKLRVIFVGPRAQAVLREFFTEHPDDYLFSPRRAVAKLHATRSANRKTPRYPSHMANNSARRTKSPRRTATEKYTSGSYGRAVLRGVEKANWPLIEAGVEIELHVPHWSPNQLRHANATEIRRLFGLEAAQVILGHERADVTQLYAEKNQELAATIAAKIG